MSLKKTQLLKLTKSIKIKFHRISLEIRAIEEVFLEN
jgi:hypothetical protein